MFGVIVKLQKMAKLVLFLLVASAFVALASASGNLVCYFTSWTVYRPGNGKFKASDVDPFLCTHVLYAFVGLREDGSVAMLDDWEANGLGELPALISLKQQNPKLKILLSMGGWNEGSYKYSQVARNAGKRAALVKDVLAWMEKYKFDGFDLDWEYPNQRGGDPADVDNFVTLLGELKAALNARGYLLTAAVAGAGPSIDKSYDVARVSQNLDFFNVMAYDFHGAFEPFVGHHAPLHPSHLDKTPEQRALNVVAGIKHWLERGADPKKINLGMGTYGRGFALANASDPELYARTYGGCEAGPYTRQMGILGYNEICEFHSNWKYTWDDEQKVPHIQQGNQWVGFEDEASLKLKTEFVVQNGLAGAMVWSLDTDDFRGICKEGKRYPLINTIKRTLGN